MLLESWKTMEEEEGDESWLNRVSEKKVRTVRRRKMPTLSCMIR